MSLFLSFLAASVGVYHARARSDLQRRIPPFVIAALLLSVAVVINFSKWTKKRKCKRVSETDSRKEEKEEIPKPELEGSA
ncbi:hypothetical protein VCV18_011418 [Metarhizium anisopliae]